MKLWQILLFWIVLIYVGLVILSPTPRPDRPTIHYEGVKR